jgi:hypothetical protein
VERSLDIALLTAALGDRTGLPTAEELQQLMADVEVQLLLRRPKIDEALFAAAWYLHGVASVSQARERYTLARQRQAFLVSAHIFDLTLNEDGWTPVERLSFGFAAAIGYRRGGRDPNATAIMNRLRDDIDVQSPVTDHIDTVSMEAGVAFLGFETRTLFGWFGSWRRQLAALARDSELDDLTTTALGPTQMLVLGAEDLLIYFARGNTDRLERGLARLRTVALGEAGPGDLNSRWVAAHLLNLSDEARAGSLWNLNVLPPTVPPLVRQAFTVGSPPVLTLWEPQRELLTGPQSPFDPDVRRMVLAVPTSSGKTLIGQLLAVEHLSRTDRSVCYVVPTRSLGREVRRAMANRVRVLEKEAGSDQPDYPTLFDFLAADATPDVPADVEVMTPERLARLLRHDADAVLDRFGMFIFDEAQLLKEPGRGFVLESVIALLDYLTHDTSHQMVLISAAMGNAGAIAQWLSPDGECLRHESQWRGPRRLHAAFTTRAHWSDTRTERGGPVWKYRHITTLSGLIRLRTANDHTTQLITDGDTGWRLVRKTKDGNQFSSDAQIDETRSTKHYVIASQMIAELGHAGSVLVVATTRDQAQRLAEGLAQTNQEQPALAPLVDFVRQQLGDDHPLVGTLRRGVGFHHAGLPIEILEALEDSVRDDTLPYLTCTSTLTDGVNLPVRTVIIYDQPYPGQPKDTQLRGARLVNAMGRAGRAGRETEGWIVLVRAAEPSEQDFQDLNPDAETLAVTSTLSDVAALEEFARLEAALRANEDAIFDATGTVADFISFVWLVLAIEEGHGGDPSSLDVNQIVDATLGAEQSDETQRRCTHIAQATRQRYINSNPEARRRWPRSGTSVGSARTIDALAQQLADEIINAIAIGDPDEVARLADASHAIQWLGAAIARLYGLSEAPEWRFRVTRRGDSIAVEPVALLLDWISGAPLPGLADRHLQQATPAAWRIEQIVGAVTEHFEHYLAWTVSALVDLLNGRLSDSAIDLRLCPELGGYIRYGVNTPHALLLMTSGIRSRRLAHAVAANLTDDVEPTHEDLRSSLAKMSIADWRERYDASASEVLDLLDFTRLRSRSLLKALLETGSVAVEIPGNDDPVSQSSRALTIERHRGQPAPQPLALYAGDRLIATIAAQDHADLQAILETGLDLALTIEGTQPRSLRIQLPLIADTDA